MSSGSPSSGRSAFVGTLVEQQVKGSMVGVPALLKDPNYGMKFDEVNPGKWVTRESTPLKNPALTGSSLEPASIPGPSTFPSDLPRPARVSSLVVPLATATGKPVLTHPGHVDTPIAPVITHGGTPGTTARSYKVVARGADGSTTAASPAGSTATGHAAPDLVDYDIITPTLPTGTATWDVFRITGGVTTGKINPAPLPAATLFFHDTGLVADGSTAPAVNRTDVVCKYAAPWSDLSEDAITETVMVQVGGDQRPMLSTGQRYSEIDLTGGSGLLTMSTKGQGTGATLLGPGVAAIGNTGTYAYSPVLKGRIQKDHAALVSGIDWKVTQVLTSGVMKIKAKSGSALTYSGDEILVYADTVTKKVIQGGANDDPSGGVELTDETGFPFGPDGTDRESLVLLLAGDLTTLLVDDEFHHDPQWLVPGLGSAPFTGIARTATSGMPLTPAHVKILIGGKYFSVDDASIKLTAQTIVNRPYGPSWKRPGQVYVNGYQGLDIEADHFWFSRELEEARLSGELLTVEVTIAGGRIPLGDGTYSKYRETLYFSHDAMQVEKVDAAVSGPAPSKEKLTFSLKASPVGTKPTLYTLCGDTFTF